MMMPALLRGSRDEQTMVLGAQGDEGEGVGGVSRNTGSFQLGMSSDFEVAIEEGATILRVGSALFASGFRNEFRK